MPTSTLSRAALWLVVLAGVAIMVSAVWAVNRFLSFKDPAPAQDYNRLYYELGLKSAGITDERENRWDQIAQVLADASAIVDAAQQEFSPSAPGGRSIDPFAQVLNSTDPGAAFAGEDAELARRMIYALERERTFAPLDRFVASGSRAALPLVDGRLFDTPRIELSSLRRTARALAFDLVASLRLADDARARIMLRRELAIGQVFARQPSLICRALGIAVVGSALDNLRREIVAGHMSVGMAEDAARVLAGLDLGALDTAIEGERLIALDAIQRTQVGPSAILKRLNPAENAEAIDRYFQRVKQARALADRAARLGATRDAVAGLGDYALAAILAQSFDKVGAAEDALRLELGGTQIMLALEVHAARHGALPATLAEIDRTILPEIPGDCYSPQGLRYRLLDPSKDPYHRPYLLYSVGDDGLDNGGKVNPKDARGAFDPSGAGVDFILNAPRDVTAPPEH